MITLSKFKLYNMKKFLFVSILVCSVLTASAQEEVTSKPTDKGHYIVDGSLFFSINNSKSGPDGFEAKSNSFSLGISPKTAYFVIDRLALGIDASFSYSNNEFTNIEGNNSSQNGTAISIGPFARYYLKNGLFAQTSVGFGISKTNAADYESKNESFRYEFGVGYAIFLNQNISLEPIISYRHVKTTHNQSTLESTNNGLVLGVGFTIYL